MLGFIVESFVHYIAAPSDQILMISCDGVDILSFGSLFRKAGGLITHADIRSD